MEPAWKRALDENVRFFQENLILSDYVFSNLSRKNILTLEMIDIIKSSSDSDHSRTIELVKCLKERNEDCFDKFLDVLYATDNKSVAEKLEQSLPPSSRKSSRKSHSSDETELLLMTRDRQILDLEEKLAAKDILIEKLEGVADGLKSQTDEILSQLQEEMRISDYYKDLRAEALYELRKVNVMKREINVKDEQLKETEKNVGQLKLRVEELQIKLESVKDDLKEKEEDLVIVLDNKRRMKKKLGLDEEASDSELIEHLQKSYHTKEELKRAQDELGDLNRTKMNLEERVNSLKHQRDSLQFELRQKELEMQRVSRKNLGSSAHPSRRTGLLERTKTLPKIDVNSFPYMSDLSALRHRITTWPNLLTARDLPSAAAQSPRMSRGKTMLSIEDREKKYCVICRKDYYLRSECRIHVASIASGKFSCCGADANAKYVGCKSVNHLFVYFTGIGNEYVFYDDRKRPLDFKEHENYT